MRQTKAGQRDTFAKSQRAVWTSEIYTVLARNGPNSWVVDVPRGEVKIYPSWALKVVGADELRRSLRDAADTTTQLHTTTRRVDVAVERAKRDFAREISEQEQKANLAAPARPRRERAVRRDYAAMAAGL